LDDDDASLLATGHFDDGLSATICVVSGKKSGEREGGEIIAIVRHSHFISSVQALEGDPKQSRDIFVFATVIFWHENRAQHVF
jgi:hypothetical protein